MIILITIKLKKFVNFIKIDHIFLILLDDFRALLLLVELLPVANSVKTRKGQGKGKDKEKEKKGKGKKRLANEENEENEPLEINFPNKYLLRLSPVSIVFISFFVSRYRNILNWFIDIIFLRF